MNTKGFYEKLKSDYKESLTKEIIRNKLDQYFKFAQTAQSTYLFRLLRYLY